MDPEHLDELFARYLEPLVVHSAPLDVDELAGGDPEVATALHERIETFQRIEEALARRSKPLTGRILLRYKVQEKLGAGGMGDVYRAQDLDLGREVAVKVLPMIIGLDPERRARFEKEARIMAALEHPHIAAIHGFDVVDGLHFLVMELVPGETLAECLKRGPLPLAKALRLFQQIGEGLEAAHEKGIVHRDLKPANVMITPGGQVKVLDFGLGKTFGAQEPAEPRESLGLRWDWPVPGVFLFNVSY